MRICLYGQFLKQMNSNSATVKVSASSVIMQEDVGIQPAHFPGHWMLLLKAVQQTCHGAASFPFTRSV